MQELMPSPTAPPPEPVRAARHSEDMSLAELNLKLASLGEESEIISEIR
jgi:hypothetical protein